MEMNDIFYDQVVAMRESRILVIGIFTAAKVHTAELNYASVLISHIMTFIA